MQGNLNVLFALEALGQETELHALFHDRYRPARDVRSATREQAYARLALVRVAAPHQHCGEARLVGYLGKEADAPALYRLKIRYRPPSFRAHSHLTLPGWFVLEAGVFAAAPSPGEAWQEDVRG